MAGRKAALALAVAAVAASAGAAVSKASLPSQRCTVQGGDKLPPGLGGGDALCAAIVRALESRKLPTPRSIGVRVSSPYAIAAVVHTADGRSLPEQRFSVSDRKLTSAALDRFARSIADQIAGAGR